VLGLWHQAELKMNSMLTHFVTYVLKAIVHPRKKKAEKSSNSYFAQPNFIGSI